MPKLPYISPDLLKNYQAQVAQSSSPATAKRKAISLNRFFDWAASQGHIDASPMPKNAAAVPAAQVVKVSKHIGTKTYATIGLTVSVIVLIILLTWKLKFPIPFIQNFAQENTNQTTQISQNLNTTNASSAGNIAWNLYAKLKLTDSSGQPLVGAQSVNFKLYTSPNGGDPIYTVGPQQVTTDTNGSALISLDQVPADIYFLNDRLYLEPDLSGQSASASGQTRIPVSTASVASNLNGYLAANPDMGANAEEVPVIDSTGALVLASQSPAIKAKQGNLLIEGQTVTIKASDGGNGNIEINPDANGYAHFLFEGNKGNFVNAQAPNLTNGSLYYGMVPNNSTGYYLVNLQNGSKLKTKFSVDAMGNTNMAGDLLTGSVDRLTNLGVLQNITGYSQNSGDFTINQKPGDFASINKTVTSGSALSDVMTLTLDERGKPATQNSDYSTLVLNRFDGNGAAAALKVNTGNAIFNGQVEIGRFQALPVAVGQGSLVFNSSDNQVYVWNGTAWIPVGGGASIPFDKITSGTNTTAAMVVGSGASLTFNGGGTIDATSLTCTGCLDFTQLSNSMTLDAATNINTNGLTLSTSGVGSLNFASTGQVNFDGNVNANNGLDVTGADLNVGGPTNFSVNVATGDVVAAGNLQLSGTTGITQYGNGAGMIFYGLGNHNLQAVSGTLRIGAAAIAGSQTVEQDVSIIPAGTTGTNDLGSATLPWDNIYGVNLYQNGNQVCDVSGFGCPANAGYWDQTLGVLYPKNNTVDVLFGASAGSTATASAKFAFTGINTGGTPTASISGTTTGVAAYLTGNGNLATTNKQALTLGGATTGNILIQSGNNLGINNAIPANKFTLDSPTTADSLADAIIGTSATTQKGLVIQGLLNQTANLQEWQNSGGTVRVSVAANGELGVFPGLESSNTPIITIDSSKSFTGTAPAAIGIRNITSASVPGSAGAGTYVGVQGVAQKTTNNNLTSVSSQLIGVQGSVKLTSAVSSGSTFKMIGVQAVANGSRSGATISNLIGFDSAIQNVAGAIVTNAYGLNIQTFPSTDKPVNSYGIYINNVVGSTSAYGIYTNAGLNRLGDQLSIVGSQDTQQLIVRGNATQTNNLAEFQTSASAVKVSIDNSGNITSAGNVAVNGGSLTSTAATFNLLNDNSAQTINFGSGTGGNTINIAGTGATGADTINIGTGGTGADAITIGNTSSTTTINLTKGASGNVVLTGYNCTLDANGGKLTTDSSGDVICAADVSGTSTSSVAWSDITSPTANLSLAMGTYNTAFNWSTGTGANNLFSLTTDSSANGTGSLLNLQTGTGSTVLPLRVRAGSVEALAVSALGNVGIGTTTPGELLSLGLAGTTKGVLSMAGDTSGKVTIQPAAAAGTWTFTLPTDSGTNNTVLTTDGSGITSWQPIPTSGTLTYYFQDTASDVVTYRKQLITPYSPKTTLTTAGLGAGNTVLGNWITAPGSPGLTSIPAGVFEFHVHTAQTAGSKTAQVYAEIWEASSTGTDIAMIGTTELSPALNGSENEYDLHLVTANTYTLASQASRITTRVYTAVSGAGTAPTVDIYYGDTADTHTALPSQTIDASNFVPYIGATTNVNLGSWDLTATNLVATNNVTGINVIGNTGVNTGAGTGTQRIDATGNLQNIGNVNGSGAITVTPAAGSNFNIALSTTGDFAVNTNQLYVDTSSGFVGIGKSVPLYNLDVNGSASFSGTLSLAPMLQVDAGTCNVSTAGKEYYDATQNSYYYCNGTVWTAISSGANSNNWTLDGTNGVLYPISQTADVLFGGTATSSAKFAFTGIDGGLPTASISGSIAGNSTYLTGNGLLATTNMQDIVLGTANSGNILIPYGNLGLNNATPGNKFSLNVPTTADSLADALIGTSATSQKGLVIQGLAGQGANLQEWQNSLGTPLSWVDASGNMRIGSSATNNGSLLDVAGASPDSALAIFDLTGGGTQNIIAASASGTTVMTLDQNGVLSLYNSTSSITNTAGDINIGAATGNINFSGDNIQNIATVSAGTGIFSNLLQVNSTSTVDYSRFGSATTAHGLTSPSDLLISGKLALEGVLYLDSNVIANAVGGTSSIILSGAPTTTASTLTASNWLVENTANLGQAALMVNQTKAGDLFTASSSGTPKFTIHNDGSITLAALSSPTTNTTPGTIYFNSTTKASNNGATTGDIFLYGEDSAFHRVALDMTQYSTNTSNVANGASITLAYNQNTNDISAVGWVQDVLTGLWTNITNFSHTIKNALQNEWDLATASNSKIRTYSSLANVQLSQSVNTGTGADGAVAPGAGTYNINTAALISGRSTSCVDAAQQGDAVNYNVTALTSTTATVSPAPSTNCLVIGDEVLLINLHGVSTNYGNVGNWETLRVANVSGTTVTFATAKTKFYGNGSGSDDTNIGLATSNQTVMLQRVPNYTNVTINSGVTLTASAWVDPTGVASGGAGKGGVLFFRANGTITVGGTIHTNNLGYLGGNHGTSSPAYGGESFCAVGSVAGGNAGNPGTAGVCGGGGGGTGAGGASGGAGSSTGGAGGGGGDSGSNGAASGGAGGYGGFGTGGNSGSSGGVGTNGSTNISGKGGNNGSPYQGGGGGGGGTYGSTALTTLMFGSGGGQGGFYSAANCSGGNGGGITYIAGGSISVSGAIQSNGQNGGGGCSQYNGGGGGGAGGSIRLEANNLTLGSSLVNATGGTGGSNTYSGPGGTGGTGIIATYYTSTTSGAAGTSPASSTQQPYYPYGLYNSTAIATPNAATLDSLRWEANYNTYGHIQFQTRAGNSTNPLDGSWQEWRDNEQGINLSKYNNTAPSNSNTTGTNGQIPLGSSGGDTSRAIPGTVIKDGSTYKMWYSGYDGSNYRIYYATSSDGLTWTKYNNSAPGTCNTGVACDIGRVGLGSSGGDTAQVFGPMVIKDSNSSGGTYTYKMWYAGSTNGTDYKIYYATSPDGLTWTKSNNTAATNCDTACETATGHVGLGVTGGDTTSVLSGSVIKDGSTYKMWYTGYDASNYRIFYATSPDGLTWTKLDNAIMAASNITGTDGRIPLGTSASYADNSGAEYPAVIKDGTTFRMLYVGIASADSKSRVRYATSPDGLTWTKYDPRYISGMASNTLNFNGKIGLGATGGDSAGVTEATLMNDGGTYKAWYTGYDSTNYRGYLASGIGYRSYNVAESKSSLWSGTNLTVSDASSQTINVNQFEDEKVTVAGANQITQLSSVGAASGYAEATIPATDLSNFDYLTGWVMATGSGNLVQLGFGESTGTDNVQTVTVDTSNTWQKVYWDISAITGGSRDGVTKVRVSVLSTNMTVYFYNLAGGRFMNSPNNSLITSTPNNYVQYRAIFSTTNTAYQPQLNNVYIVYNDGYKIVQTDTNTAQLYNYTGATQNLRLDVTVFGADLAEWYTVDDQNIAAGDMVALTGKLDDSGVPILTKAKGINDPNLIGIISTKAGQTLGIQADNRRLLALAGRVPVKMDPESPTIAAGDGITSSDKPGLARKAQFGDVVVAKALQAWTPGQSELFVIVNNSNSRNTYLTSLQDYQLIQNAATGTWEAVNTRTQEAVKTAAVFGDLMATNIKAGAIISKNFATDNLNAAIAFIDHLTTNNLAVKLISPVPGDTNVTVQLGSATESGKLAITNGNGVEVASIDSAGNATFSGTVSSQQLTVNSSATVSGDLYADTIHSLTIDQIKEQLAEVQADQNVLDQMTNWKQELATNSASLNELAVADLYITNQAAINSLSVTTNLTIGTDMVIGSTNNSIDSLSAPLKIQSLAMSPIQFMAGLVSIDTHGNMNIAGDLFVAGRINSSGLTLKDQFNSSSVQQSTQSATLLTLQNSSGDTVSSIDASGSAQFGLLSTQGLTIAGAVDATNSAVINGIINTNSTVGNAVIPAGVSEITIRNPKVNDYTLVYVTPTSTTDNYVLYVKSKQAGQFVVGFTNPIAIDVNFNWWIVQIAQ